MARRGTRLGIAMVVVAALFVVFPPSARACSCAPMENPRAMLARAEGAFVGTIERIEHDGAGQARFHYRVERVVKAVAGETVVVHTPDNGGMCGLEGQQGDRDGLLISRDDEGRWTGNLCSSPLGAERLLEAWRPLPAPTGTGPPALVVGASLGEHRTILLDGAGKTLGYGPSPADAASVQAIDVCPGADRAVEGLGASYRSETGPLLTVRALDGMRAERHVDRSHLPGVTSQWPTVASVQCRTPDADHIDVGIQEVEKASVWRSRSGTWREVWRGDARPEVAHGSAVAVLASREGVDRLDLETGTVTNLYRGHTGWFGSVTPSGGLFAFLITGAEGAHEEIVVVDVSTGVVQARHRFSPPLSGVDLDWVDDDTLALLQVGASQVVFFDARLRQVGAVAGWPTYRIYATGGAVYGTGPEPGVVVWATPRSTTAERFARVPDGATYAFAALPGAPSPPASPTTTTTTVAEAEAATTTTTTSTTTLPTSVDGEPAATSAPVPPKERSRPWGPATLAAVLLAATATLCTDRAVKRRDPYTSSGNGRAGAG